MIIKLNKRLAATIIAAAVLAVMLIAADKPRSETTRLPVIMYHHISSNNQGQYVISPEQLRKDLEYIKSQGYTAVTAEQLLNYVSGKSKLPEKPVLITFDDGYESFYTYAFPILKDLNMSAVLSVIGTYSQLYTEIGDNNPEYAHVTWSQIAEMADSGYVDIGNHTYDLHKLGNRIGCNIMSSESEADYRKMLTDDITKLQEKLKEVTQKETAVFAYPFGKHCALGSEIIKELGFKITLGCGEKVNTLEVGNKSCLFMLGRFNRPHGKTSESFFSEILKNQ